jgi:hypothetical protein
LAEPSHQQGPRSTAPSWPKGHIDGVICGGAGVRQDEIRSPECRLVWGVTFCKCNKRYIHLQCRSVGVKGTWLGKGKGN